MKTILCGGTDPDWPDTACVNDPDCSGEHMFPIGRTFEEALQQKAYDLRCSGQDFKLTITYAICGWSLDIPTDLTGFASPLRQTTMASALDALAIIHAQKCKVCPKRPR